MSEDDQNTERARLGDFEIIGELGRGGMGVVYRAVQLSLDRKVALKVLKGSFTLTAGSVERFKREAAAAARLHHTNIVPVYATGTVEEQHYYAMELIEGGSLDRVLDQIRMAQSSPELKVPPNTADETVAVDNLEPTVVDHSSDAEETATSTQSALTSASGVTGGRRYFDSVARLMADVADALDYAHSQGVVHRDIKPANLILSNENRVYITDFGLARLQEAEGLTVTGGVMGSPHYMSPEQVVPHSDDLDHRTDVYSLGVTLYELLTLRAPFKGVSKAQILNHILSKEPPRPRRLDRHIPQDLETICLKAMEKRPDRRYATARELADDLRRYVNRFTISARPVSLGERAFRWSQRHPSTAGLIAASVVAIAAISGLWIVNSYRGQLEETNAKLIQTLDSEEKAREDAENAREDAENAREAADIQKHFGQYVVNIGEANRALERNDGPTAESHLLAIEEDPGQRAMIGFEWGYLTSKYNRWQGNNVNRKYGGNLYGCAFSPDRKILAIAGWSQVVELFYGMPRHTNVIALAGHDKTLNKLAFSADGSLLASSSDDRRIGIWEMDSEPPRLRFFLTGHRDYVYDVSFDATGKRLVSAGKDGSIMVWDVEHGLELRTLIGHEGKVFSVAWSQGPGRRIASAGEDGTVRLWDPETFEEVARSRTFEESVHGIDFSPDGSMLASGGMDDVVRLFEVEDLREIGAMSGHSSGVRDVRFSPFGRWVASVGLDLSVRLWDVASRRQFRLFHGHSAEVTAAGFASDEKGLASVGLDGSVKLWDLNRVDVDDDAAFFAPGKVWVVRQSPDGKSVATIETMSSYSEKTLRIWQFNGDTASTKLIEWKDSFAGPYTDCAFSPDGTLLASCAKNEVLLWNPIAGEIVDRWVCSEAEVSGVTFSPNGELMGVWGGDGKVRFYDPETKALQHELIIGEDGHGVTRVRFTPDGLHVVTLTSVARQQNSIRIWDVAEFKLIHEIHPPEKDSITTFAVSSDSNSVAIGTLGGRINYWVRDRSTFGFEDWRKHGSRLMALAFLDDDNTLVTASREKTVKFWNLKMKREVVTVDTSYMDELSVSTGVTDFDMRPDGTGFLTAAGQPRVQAWTKEDSVEKRSP